MTPADLNLIIRSSRGYNFHTHTPWCDGHDDPKAMARAAVRAGFSHLGFSPHSPIPIPSPCNMAMDDVPAYLGAVLALKSEFDQDLKIFAGMEVDYLHRLFGPSAPQIQDIPLDFRIGSVHFIPRPDGRFVDIDGSFDSFRRKMADDFSNDLRYVVNTFYEASSEMISRGGFEILGHADKVSMNASLFDPDLEQHGWYNDLVSAYLDQVIASGLIVEINTKARTTKGRFFPHERFWPRLEAAGVSLMVNSDAHYADKINASRAEAFDLLCTHA